MIVKICAVVQPSINEDPLTTTMGASIDIEAGTGRFADPSAPTFKLNCNAPPKSSLSM